MTILECSVMTILCAIACISLPRALMTLETATRKKVS